MLSVSGAIQSMRISFYFVFHKKMSIWVDLSGLSRCHVTPITSVRYSNNRFTCKQMLNCKVIIRYKGLQNQRQSRQHYLHRCHHFNRISACNNRTYTRSYRSWSMYFFILIIITGTKRSPLNRVIDSRGRYLMSVTIGPLDIGHWNQHFKGIPTSERF